MPKSEHSTPRFAREPCAACQHLLHRGSVKACLAEDRTGDRFCTCKKDHRSPKYYPFEFTARECRELAEALTLASAYGIVADRRAYRLWLCLDSTADLEDK